MARVSSEQQLSACILTINTSLINLETRSPSQAEVQEILYIPADEYDLWIRVLQGLHDLGDHMLDLAIEWSAKSASISRDALNKSETFTSGGGLTWSTVCAKPPSWS